MASILLGSPLTDPVVVLALPRLVGYTLAIVAVATITGYLIPT